MKKIHKKLWIGYLFCSLEMGLYGASFNFPNRTPGLEAGIAHPPTNPILNCKHIIVPGTHCHLYFPVDGSQPSTEEAGVWSGARHVNQNNDNAVTEWWVRVFGGNRAIQLLYGNYVVPNGDNLLPMGYNNMGDPHHIMEVVGTVNFEQQFWRTFRDIAADPVGRVLLYRLLIEIRRTVAVGNNDGCCENGINVVNLDERNDCRSIQIRNSNNGCAFAYDIIEVDLNINITTSTLALNGNNHLTTNDENRTYDIALFHEILHWFHYLRNPDRFAALDSDDPLEFKYPLRCYYGNINELCVWSGVANAEEIATILGTPNLNPLNNLLQFIPNNAFLLNRRNADDREVTINGVNQFIPISEYYLNGDDLSENVYRASRGNHMRFGHVTTAIESVPFQPNPPNRFQLAHQLVHRCYQQITGHALEHWGLVQGEAIQM